MTYAIGTRSHYKPESLRKAKEGDVKFIRKDKKMAIFEFRITKNEGKYTDGGWWVKIGWLSDYS